MKKRIIKPLQWFNVYGQYELPECKDNALDFGKSKSVNLFLLYFSWRVHSRPSSSETVVAQPTLSSSMTDWNGHQYLLRSPPRYVKRCV